MSIITTGAYLAKVRTRRAAAVPYIVRNKRGRKTIYFLFAKDAATGDITDLGGGVKKTEYSLSAGLRELYEESNEIFGKMHENTNNFSTNIAVLGKGKNCSVLFIPVDEKWYKDAPRRFINKKGEHHGRKSYNEVSELIWLSEWELKRLVATKNRKMWERIRRFYHDSYSVDLMESLRIVYAP